MPEDVEVAQAEEASQEDIIALNEQRSATYGLLARLYRSEVDEELLQSMRQMLFVRYTGNEHMDKGHLLIATYLSNLWENSLTDLKVDYSRVFIGHGTTAYGAAYPFESVYTSPKRLLMQGARDEVRRIYRKNGLKKQDSWKDGEDHIALELTFQQTLTDRTVQALRDGDEDRACELLSTQRDFMEEHLASWVPMMTADMKRFAQTKMYEGLAYLTEGFIESDQLFLRSILVEDEQEG